MLVMYYRDFYGHRGYKNIYRFAGIRDYQIKEKAAEFWKEFDEVTSHLVESGQMWHQHLKDAETKIARRIPRPAVLVVRPPLASDRTQAVKEKYGLV